MLSEQILSDNLKKIGLALAKSGKMVYNIYVWYMCGADIP